MMEDTGVVESWDSRNGNLKIDPIETSLRVILLRVNPLEPEELSLRLFHQILNMILILSQELNLDGKIFLDS